MSFQSYKLLRQIKRVAQNTEMPVSVCMDSTLRCTVCDKANSVSFSKYDLEIDSLLDELSSGGYISYLRTTKDEFNLTAKGIHVFQYFLSLLLKFSFVRLVDFCLGFLAGLLIGYALFLNGWN